MAHLLRMPAVLAGATEAILLSWHVKPGDAFVAGDALAEIETDKALVELEAEEAGTLGRAVAIDGQKVSVGDPIAVLVADGDTEADIDAALATAGDFAEAEADSAQVVEPAEQLEATSAVETSRLFVSPLVRRLAREQGIDPSVISGTGPGGRIVRRDLLAWLDSTPSTAPAAATPPRAAASPTAATAAGFEDIPHTGMRRAIARRLTESKSTVPHFYLVADLRVDKLLALRAEVNATPDVRVSVNDLLIKAIAAAYREVPEANVIWTDDALRRFDAVDIAVAVSTEKGLVTPVVRDVASLSLTQLSAAVAELVERARAGRLQQHELEGGSFSISNLGMFGTQEFSAILNPPQSGILAVGAARDEVVATDGAATVEKVMTVTMSVDHRAVDGALAAQWLAAFTAVVEHPVRMLL
jgi:pyruvate dehydrogenase E2 component (dihydrolipoamide acetyltransferase)